MNIQITRVNISSPLGCGIKTIECDKPAFWFVGKLSLCEEHFKLFCEKAGIDYDSCVKEIKENFNKTLTIN